LGGNVRTDAGGRRTNSSITRRVTDGASSASPDPVDELLGGDVLEEKPARANPERVVDVLVHVERGQHHDLDRRTVLGQESASRLDPVDVWHANVHQDDVGSQPLCLRDRLPPVRGLSDDLHVLFGLKDHAEARADEGLVVHDEDAEAHAGTTGSFARNR
jgi:hypothetical protein